MAGRDEQWRFVHEPQTEPHVHLEDSGSRRRSSSEPPPCGSGVACSSLETQVLSDLEAFFEEMDLGNDTQEVSVPYMKAADIRQLRRIRYEGQPSTAVTISADAAPATTVATTAANQASEDSLVECVVCLSTLKKGEWLLEMPCDERHRLHEQCARSWLARSAACPLCRVDVRTLLPGLQAANAENAVSAGTAGRGRRARRRRRRGGRRPQAGADGQVAIPGARTRDGGIISRFEPHPPTSWDRPVYIPERLWHLAQYFEVSYPGMGLARVWRVAGSLQLNQRGSS